MNGPQVRITAKEPEINGLFDLGDGSPVVTGGLGGWKIVERQDDIAATIWSGQEPLTADVPIMLDGYANDSGVASQLNTLFKLGRDARGDENVPPVFKLYGPIAPIPDGKEWVLGDNGIDLDPDSVIRSDGGDLMRQALVLHLLEYVRPDVIRLRHKKRRNERTGLGQATPVIYETRKGDTLESIAVAVFHDHKKWKQIGDLNNLHDPHRILPAGKTLRLS